MRNTVASTGSFLFDLGLLWLFVELFGMNRLVAVSLAFLLAISLHYALARVWVFRGTTRGIASGYAYFLINAGVGLAVTLGLFVLLSDVLDWHYLASRALSSVAAGLVVFFLNAVFNFKQL